MRGHSLSLREQRSLKGDWEDGRHRKSDARPLLKTLVALTAFGAVSSLILLLLSASELPIKSPGRVLVVTAHPDDETVFFGPTITALRAAKHEVFLYCLTKGNARGIGDLRTKELANAAGALQINGDHLLIEDNEIELPDSKTVDWNLALATELVSKFVRQRSIDTIITFDRGGITGHKNHMSCWQTVRRYVLECKGKGCPIAYSVLTAGKWQNYNHLFAKTPSASRPETRKLAKYLNYRVWRVFWAMHYHKSQWRWWSHVLFTRYTYINSLQLIDARTRPEMSTA